MKNLHIAICLLILTGTQSVFAKTTQLEFVQDVAKQIDYVEQSKNVWPGFHPGNMPSIIEFENDDEKKSAYAINFKPVNPSWKMLQNTAKPIYFLQDSASLKLKDSGLMKIDDQLSFVELDTDNFSAKQNVSNPFMQKRMSYYLAHESAIDAKNIKALRASYDSFNDPALVKLMYLEDTALTLAQQSDTGAAEEALRDAVAIHQYRNQEMSQSAREFENANEIIKGTPVYVGWSSKQLNDEDYKKMTQRTGCMPLNGMLDAKNIATCNNAEFPAFVSSVYGHALEKKIPNSDWKKSVETQFKSISHVAIDYYHFSDEQAKLMVKQAMAKPAYHYDRIERIVDHSMQSYLENMHAAINAYQAQAGTELRIPGEFGSVIMLLGALTDGFSDAYTLNSTTVLVQDISISVPLSKDKREERFTLTHMPFMKVVSIAKDFSGEMDADLSFTSFKLTEKAELTIDGKTILVSDFVRAKKVQDFDKLIIHDEHIHLPLSEKGKLDASEGVLKLIGIE